MIGLLNNVREFIHVKKKDARYKKTFAEQNATFDRFIISYPKAGRTWHRVMLGFYLARMTNSQATEALQFDVLCQRAGLPRITYTHNATKPIALLPASNQWVASSDQWRSRNVLLLVREPKAVLVSSFHHARFRAKYFDGGLSEFIRDPRFGIDKVATAYRRWHANRHLASTFTVICYEQMHACPDDVLRRTLSFIGAPAPDAAIIAEAVNFARFDNMKRYEETDFFSSQGMRKKHADDPDEGRKVREGKTDSFKSHLSDDDIAYIDRRLAELGGNPFAELSVVA